MGHLSSWHVRIWATRVVSGMIVLGMIGAGLLHQPAAVASSSVLVYPNIGVKDLPSIDPVLGGDSNSNEAANILYSGLVKLTPDQKPVGDVASRWTVSADGKTYTFALRPTARFSDGTPLTSADVVYSLQRALEPRFASAGSQGSLTHIVGAATTIAGKTKSASGIKALGPYTVQITIDQPVPYFPDLLTFSVAKIVDRHVIARYGEGKWFDHAVGSGPWMIKKWIHNQEIIFVPSPYYFGAHPRLSEYDMPFVLDPMTAYAEYQTNQIMIDDQVPATEYLNAQKLAGFQSVPLLQTDYLGMDNNIAPMNNLKVRLALTYALDRQLLAQRILKGAVRAATGILPPGMPCWTSANQNLIPYDPATARRLLAEAGYPNGKGLPAITFSFQSGSALNLIREAQAMQQLWKQNLGITVSLNQVELAKYNNDLNSHQVQMYEIQWGEDYPDPSDWLSLQLHSNVPNNNGNWSNAAFDKLVDRADVSQNQALRCGMYDQAERIAILNGAWIPLDNQLGNVLIAPALHGVQMTAGGLSFPDWSKVY